MKTGATTYRRALIGVAVAIATGAVFIARRKLILQAAVNLKRRVRRTLISAVLHDASEIAT